ncbi:MAG: restriction endonuclease subunit S [Pseudomonadota bacterium]|nr:restriction endonuclease subunit S [Pseudomonadota bacterium]
MYEFIGTEDWSNISLYDVANWKNGLAFKNIDFSQSGLPVIKIAELKNGITDQTKFTDSKYSEDVFIKRGDMVFAWSGSPQTSIDTFRWGGVDGWLNQHIFKVTPHDFISDQFLFFLLKSLRSRFVQIALNKQTTGLGHVTVADLKEMRVGIPNLSEQRSIVNIIAPLHEKIENNRQMNETLEEMARAIFKSWFVDFDPVHAKAADNAPAHMDAETAALFPSSFGDDGLPVGWEEEHLHNLIDFKEGPGLRNWQYTNSDEGIRFINIRCIKNGDLELTTANRITEAEAYGRYAHFLLEAGDIVVSTSGTLGRLSFVREEHLPLMLNTSVIRMRPISKRSTREFLYAYLGSKEFQNELEIRATGSAQRNFGPMHLNQMHIKVPKFEIIDAYSQKTSPIVEKFLSNQKENQTLAELRDALLPKLMSGEIRVKDAERDVEEAL